MPSCGAVLRSFGAHAQVMLLASLVVGALAPSAAVMSESALPVAAFLMMFGSLIAAGLAPRERPNSMIKLGVLILAVAAGPCFVVALGVNEFDLKGDLALGVILSVAGPPVASAAALAAILGLPPRLALTLSIVPILLCPLIMPIVVGIFAGETINALALAISLVTVVGAASLAAAIVLAATRKLEDRASASLAASGVSIIGLMAVGVAAAARARVEANADFAGFGALTLGALLLCVILGMIGAISFAALGSAQAGTLGLVWGLRNQSLVWAALGTTLPLEAERFLVAMVLPSLILPALVRMFQPGGERHLIFRSKSS